MTPRRPEDADLPELAYWLWLGDARRNGAEVARRMGLSPSTVKSWGQRYRWEERAAADDAELFRSNRADAWRKLAEALPFAVSRFLQGIGYPLAFPGVEGANSEDDGPRLPPPDKEQAKSLLAMLAMFGITPTRHVVLSAGPAVSGAAVSDAALDALAASDDLDTLIALAAGQVALPAGGEEPALPGDFTSAQPGGRVEPEPPPPVPPEPKSRTRKQPDPFEATWRELNLDES